MKKSWQQTVQLLSLLAGSFSIFLSTQQAYALPAKGDFDNDGLADFSAVSVDRTAKVTSWFVRRSSGGANLNYSFNHPADALVSGRFFGGSASFPGIVYVSDASKSLEWYIKNPSGGENAFQYGLPGDTISNQGDLDCDGVTDVIVTRPGSASRYPGFRLWYVALSSAPGIVQETVFGVSGDRVGVADMDGDGCDEMVALRDNFTWFSKKLFAPEVTQTQWGLPGDIPLFPADLNGDGRADYIVARQSVTGQLAYVRYSDIASAVLPLGSNTSVPMVGRYFSSGTDFAWQERKTGFSAARLIDGSPLVFAWGSNSATIVRPDGTVVLANESGALNPSPIITPNTNPSSSSGYKYISISVTQPSKTGPTLDNPSGMTSSISLPKRVTWKPVTSDGKLAISMPVDFFGKVASVGIYNAANRALIAEQTSPRGDDDGRQLFRFPHPGSFYGNNLNILVTRFDGQIRVYHIVKGSDFNVFDENRFDPQLP